MRPHSATMRRKRLDSSAVSWKSFGAASGTGLRPRAAPADQGTSGMPWETTQRGNFAWTVFISGPSVLAVLVGAFARLGYAVKLEAADRCRHPSPGPLPLHSHDACNAIHRDRAARKAVEIEPELHRLPFLERHVGHEVNAARADVAHDALAAFQPDREPGGHSLVLTSGHGDLRKTCGTSWERIVEQPFPSGASDKYCFVGYVCHAKTHDMRPGATARRI